MGELHWGSCRGQALPHKGQTEVVNAPRAPAANLKNAAQQVSHAGVVEHGEVKD